MNPCFHPPLRLFDERPIVKANRIRINLRTNRTRLVDVSLNRTYDMSTMMGRTCKTLMHAAMHEPTVATLSTLLAVEEAEALERLTTVADADGLLPVHYAAGFREFVFSIHVAQLLIF